MKTIGIIGGGAVGVSALYQMVVSAEVPLQIVIFNQGGTLGPGMPYSTPCPDHILNLPADISSAVPGKRKHFREWLHAYPKQWRPAYPDYDPAFDQFPPRELFGRYLSWIAIEAQRIARQKGIHLHIVTGVVFDLERGDVNKWCIHYTEREEDKHLLADKILLATGHMPSSPYPNLVPQSGYMADPWGKLPDDLALLPKHTVIGLIGTRLTATDCLFRLRYAGFKGRVMMVSRSGRLPAIIGHTQPHKFLYLTPRKLSNIHDARADGYIPLDTILDLFWQEMSEAVGHEVAMEHVSKTPHPKKWLQREIKRASSGNETKWQSVLYSLYTMTPSIWNYLNDSDKARFMTQYHSLFMTYLAAFPKVTAEKLLLELESDSLEVLGGLRSIEVKRDNGFSIVCDAGEKQCLYLINATGPGYDIEHSHNPLLNTMLKRGICTKHPFGGIDVDFENFTVRDSDGVFQHNLFCVGELARGVRWATTDLGQASRHVESCLPCLVSEPKPRDSWSACFEWCGWFRQQDRKPTMTVNQTKEADTKIPNPDLQHMCFIL